jgi:hypothetical protein
LKPNTSAVIATTSSAFLKAVREQVDVADTRAIVAELAAEISNRLDEGKSMALGLILAEDGLALKEVAVSEDSAEVFGFAVTDEAVVAGAAVATGEGVAYEVGVATEEGAVVEAGLLTEDEAAVLDVVAIPEESDQDEAPAEDAPEEA